MNKDGCPDEFGCVNAGAGGVCWPGAGGDGGCSTTRGDQGIVLLGLAFGALVLGNRRRRAA